MILNSWGHEAEFPESLVSDSNLRVSRPKTRPRLGLHVQGLPSLGLGIGLEVFSSSRLECGANFHTFYG